MRKWLLLVVILTAAGVAAWSFRTPISNALRLTTKGVELGFRQKFKPDPQKYAVLGKDLERWRQDLAARHRKARTAADRAAVEHDARVILEHSLPEMMRCWLGTPWDFNGTADGPGGGKIACGYFVATLLKDAGFRVDRYQLAQQPSGNTTKPSPPMSRNSNPAFTSSDWTPMSASSSCGMAASVSSTHPARGRGASWTKAARTPPCSSARTGACWET